MEEKRKLKASRHRLPEETVRVTELREQLVEETGYPMSKISYITKCYHDIVVKNIMEGKLVYLENIGKIYAGVNPPRKVVDFKNKPDASGRTLGVKGMTVKTKQQGARYVTKFKASNALRTALSDKGEPSKEEIDKIYID